MIIDKPMYVQDMVKEGLTREQIEQRYCDAVNNLYFEYIEKKEQATEEKAEETKEE